MTTADLDTLEFRFAHQHVRVQSSLCEVIACLRAVWGGVSGPAPDEVTCFSVLPHGQGARIVHDGELVEDETCFADIVPLIESRLYQSLWSLSGDAALLHAACVARGEHVLVFTGPSGAGKSTFALAAVRAGLDYVADELTLTDGEQVWGVGRAVLFDPVPTEIPPAVYHAGADMDSYHVVDSAGRAKRLPIFPIDRARILTEPFALGRVDVVHLARGSGNELEPCPGIESLRRLLTTAYLPGYFDLAAFAKHGWLLEWSDPARAWTLLEERVLGVTQLASAQQMPAR